MIPYNGDSNTFDTADYLVEATINGIEQQTLTNSFGSYDNVTGWTEITDVQGSFNPTTGVYTIPITTSTTAGEGYTIEYEVNYEFYVDNTNSVDVYNMYNSYTARPRIAVSVEGYQDQVSNVANTQIIGTQFTLAPGIHNFTPAASGIKTGGLIAMQNASGSQEILAADELKIQIGVQQQFTAWFTNTTFPYTPAPNPVYSVLKVNRLRVRILPTANIQVMGGILGMNQYVPLKIKQSDFVKSIFQMYNLFADSDVVSFQFLVSTTPLPML